MIIAVTGHQRIPDMVAAFVRDGVRAYLAAYLGAGGNEVNGSRGDGNVLVSCLAVGADQMVTDIALDLGYRLRAMIPSHGYESTFDADGLVSYRRLLARADETVILDFDHPCGAAYMAAGLRLVDECDALLAIWDGFPAEGLGGTGDVVAYAGRRGVPMHVVWPQGVRH